MGSRRAEKVMIVISPWMERFVAWADPLLERVSNWIEKDPPEDPLGDSR